METSAFNISDWLSLKDLTAVHSHVFISPPSHCHLVLTPGSLSHPTPQPLPLSARSLLIFLLIGSNNTSSSVPQTHFTPKSVKGFFWVLPKTKKLNNELLVCFPVRNPKVTPWKTSEFIKARLDFIILLYVQEVQLQETLCSHFSVEIEGCHTSSSLFGTGVLLVYRRQSLVLHTFTVLKIDNSSSMQSQFLTWKNRRQKPEDKKLKYLSERKIQHNKI